MANAEQDQIRVLGFRKIQNVARGAPDEHVIPGGDGPGASTGELDKRLPGMRGDSGDPRLKFVDPVERRGPRFFDDV
jgi:hypothetical protein